MIKKPLLKDTWRSFKKSPSRFLSIMLLTLLGTFALIGLKVTSPNMERTSSQFLKKHQVMDISVMSEFGLTEEDQKELQKIKGITIEYGYLTDVNLADSDKAVRVFSDSSQLSSYELESGKLPSQPDEIALATLLKGEYDEGDVVRFHKDDQGLLKQMTYKVVGFVNSSEIWSDKNLGSSTAGDGSLSAYAVVDPSAFNSEVFHIARLAYHDLKGTNPYSEYYESRLNAYQRTLDNRLFDNGSKRLATIKAEMQDSLQHVQDELDISKKQLAKQEESIASLSDSQKSLAKEKLATTKTKIAEQENKIKERQDKINSLKEPTYHSYTRLNFPGGDGYQTYGSISKNINYIGNIFPIVLYLVAALVVFTTMTRFVNEERQNSGVLKALGYSNSDIARKFILYVLVSSLLGTILGVFGGHYFLPKILTQNVSNMVVGQPNLYFYWSYTLLALMLSLMSAVVPDFLVIRRELAEKPAQLLLPKPPVNGAKIFLERINFIWKRFSFTQKVTARNIFRYKLRMLMTIIGVSGSVALLFTGLGLQSSLGKLVDNQFKVLTNYDMLLVRKDEADSERTREVTDYLKSAAVSDYQEIYWKAFEQHIDKADEKHSFSLMVSSQSDFKNFIRLQDTQTRKKLKLSSQGVILSEKLAHYYEVQKGDTFSITDKDKIYQLKVDAVVEMNVGNYIFMNDTYYQRIFKEKANQNAVLITLNNASASNLPVEASKLLTMKGVSNLSQNSSLIKMVQSAVKGLNSSMVILIIVSVLLAVVILYNLTNINVAERIRELSTIKVLGFHSKEVTLYIYQETISLSIIGSILGLIGGYYLHRLIIKMMSQDTIYPTDVDWQVYAIPIAVIAVILIALGWFVNHRLKVVDMLEALKSVD